MMAMATAIKSHSPFILPLLLLLNTIPTTHHYHHYLLLLLLLPLLLLPPLLLTSIFIRGHAPNFSAIAKSTAALPYNPPNMETSRRE